MIHLTFNYIWMASPSWFSYSLYLFFLYNLIYRDLQIPYRRFTASLHTLLIFIGSGCTIWKIFLEANLEDRILTSELWKGGNAPFLPIKMSYCGGLNMYHDPLVTGGRKGQVFSKCWCIYHVISHVIQPSELVRGTKTDTSIWWIEIKLQALLWIAHMPPKQMNQKV